MELAIIIVGAIASLIILVVTIIVVGYFCSNGTNSQTFVFPISGLAILGFNGLLYYFAITNASVETICMFGIPALLLDIAVMSVMFLYKEHISTGILLLSPSAALFILALVQ